MSSPLVRVWLDATGNRAAREAAVKKAAAQVRAGGIFRRADESSKVRPLPKHGAE